MPSLSYHTDLSISAAQLADLFTRSGINRPTEELPRMAQMLQHANILVTVWDQQKLVGVARALSDFCYCCYLSDLAVDRAYQKTGIGKQLIKLVHELIGPRTNLLLVAAPSATTYYPKIGFEAVPSAWVIRRTE
ncbi:GNAT family N-acetyltransferase [Undibacterium sp. Ren11W]|uniref:GNAT family N-acetyltransferase n=1 Tax=Undibacterium sp. Ren11W TaxID=3413045 RepID=UPI003BF14574